MGQVLQKVEEEEVKLTLIAPIWPTQPWFSKRLHLIAADSYILPKLKNLIQHPSDSTKVHSIQTMRLAAFQLSGIRSDYLTYRGKLPKLSCSLGENQQKDNIDVISRNGCVFVVDNVLIQLTHL